MPRSIRRLLAVGLMTASMVLFFMTLRANVTVSPGEYGPPAPLYQTGTGDRLPDVSCAAAYLLDNTVSGDLYGKDPYVARPIASITKLLTALTFLDCKVDWEAEVVMDTCDANNSSRSPLRAGKSYRVRDLFHCSLMASDNRATRALVRSTGLAIDSFVSLMNRKALENGLFTLSVDEVTGLSPNNVCSAFDCARLLNLAVADPVIHDVMLKSSYVFYSRDRRLPYFIGNTNRLLTGGWLVEGGKTGYIAEAGWCFVSRVNDGRGHDLTGVVLGARSNGSRFRQSIRLFQWAFSTLQNPASSRRKTS